MVEIQPPQDKPEGLQQIAHFKAYFNTIVSDIIIFPYG